MEATLGRMASLAASGTWLVGVIPIVRARTISATLRGTFNASGTANLRCNFLYSPDGKNWDTEAKMWFDLTVSAGNNCQTSDILATPEHGYIQIQIKNLDTGQAVTNIAVWYSVQSWPDTPPSYGGIPQHIEQNRK